MDKYLVEEVKSKSSKIKGRTTSPTQSDILPAEKIVHIIKLLASYPAKPMGIIWNKELNEPLICMGSNHLTSTDRNNPASWFLSKGITVQSKKINGYWHSKQDRRSCERRHLFCACLIIPR